MKRPFNLARVIKTTEFVPASAVLDQNDLDNFAGSNQITWGDADRTLVTVQRIADELGYVPVKLLDARHDLYIDLEN